MCSSSCVDERETEKSIGKSLSSSQLKYTVGIRFFGVIFPLFNVIMVSALLSPR
jgi:hypothetical protein